MWKGGVNPPLCRNGKSPTHIKRTIPSRKISKTTIFVLVLSPLQAGFLMAKEITTNTITQEYPGIESWAVFAGIAANESSNDDAVEIYANPDWVNLSVQNPHFNILHAYDFFAKHNQNENIIEDHLKLQIESAFNEDFLGTGRYDLELMQRPDGVKVFTNPSFPDQGLIETANRAVSEKQMKQLPHKREMREKDLAKKLTHFYEENPIGSSCLWTSPPGDEKDYSEQMSISYIGEIQPSETSLNGKKLHIELVVHKLSIFGHQKLLEKVTHQQYQSFKNDYDFVGELIHLNNDIQKQSIEDLSHTISELEFQGLVNPLAKPKKYVTEKIMSDTSDQIKEFCIFLHKTFKKVYSAKMLQIVQSDIDNLEKAYSLGYRGVLNYFNKKQLVTAVQMESDIYQAEQLMSRAKKREREIAPREAQIVHAFISQLNDRYGDLREIRVGGGGCPGGTLTGFGFDSIFVNGIEFDLAQSFPVTEKWSYHNGTCRCCRRSNIEVGPCEICKRCEKEFDNKD